MRSLKLLFPMLLLGLLALAGASCSSDGGGSPTGNHDTNTDDFDEATAISQSQLSANEAASLVGSMQAIAQGVGKSERLDGYAWNPETGAYEWHYEWGEGGYTYVWNYAVQYLDDMGEPQENPGGAAEVRHDMTGTGHYADTIQQGGSFVYDYVYEYHTALTGMGTGTLLMTGNGGTQIDYSYVYGNNNQEYHYDVEWSTDDNSGLREGGVTMPEGSGCPSGSIHYDMSPYDMEIVFDGDNTAPYTLYNASGGVVAGGSGTEPLNCN